MAAISALAKYLSVTASTKLASSAQFGAALTSALVPLLPTLLADEFDNFVIATLSVCDPGYPDPQRQ